MRLVVINTDNLEIGSDQMYNRLWGSFDYELSEWYI